MLGVPCHICGVEEADQISGQEWTISETVYRLAKCRACGSAFTTPLPSDETLRQLYRDSFDYRWYRDHLWAKRKDARIRYDEYKPLLGKRVLDFGGGIGYFSEVCREHGHDSVTFDPYASSNIAENTYDTVVALHVLEHANDVERMLGIIKSLLAPGGNLILAVPNFDGLGYRELGFQWVWAQPPLIHTQHFTTAGLEALLARCGFDDLSASYHERWDANNYCDVENSKYFARWGGYWAKSPYNRYVAYRRLIARINSIKRFCGLEHALRNAPENDRDLSELQIVARYFAPSI